MGNKLLYGTGLLMILLFHAHLVWGNLTAGLNAGELRINDIHLEGNELTKRNIIIRELMFREGDAIRPGQLTELLEKSKDNLLNLSLFNYVNYRIDSLDPRHNKIDVIIRVEERWYIWPTPIFEHADRNLSNFIREFDWQKLNYGLFIDHNNFRGRNMSLHLKTRFGYKEQFALSLSKPNMGKKQRLKLISDFNLFRKHELAYETRRNEPVFYQSFARYHWNAIDASAGIEFRPEFYNYHQFKLGYKHMDVSDTIAMLNPNYLGDGSMYQEYLTFHYNFIRDTRNSRFYPLHGYLFNLAFYKNGLNLLAEENYQNMILSQTLSYHNHLAGKWYYSSGYKWKYSFRKNIPYNQKEALGYEIMLHGFEYYVADGPSYFISKNNLKYELLPKQVNEYPFIPLDKFNKIHYSIYTNLYFDIGYIRDPFLPDQSNTLVNQWLYSLSVGLDLVTYYDRTFRIEYSLNSQGDHGLFLHIDAAILRPAK